MTPETNTDRVYFAHDAACGMVKIGHSTNPEGRVRGFRTGNPADLALIGTVPGGAAEEKRIHDELRPYRHRDEWFRATPAVLRFIHGLLLHAERPRTVAAELERRNRCRAGLAGVEIALAGEGPDVFVVRSSSWGAGGKLLLKVIPAGALDEDDVIRGVPAENAYLLSEWPVRCRCWLPTGDEPAGS